MSRVVQTLLAVVVPIAWGLLSSWAFGKVEARRQCDGSEDTQGGGD